jgi:hydrogenase maturation protein HypF
MLKRCRIKVKGIVQGVGFRPFVYRLANDLELNGFVRNTTNGVDIEIEGKNRDIIRFVSRLQVDKPRAARIDGLLTKFLRPDGDKHFVIRRSKISKGFTQISPDIATCEDCLNELYGLHDRRYGFPFINCTNCGPRYSIILETPYDRKKTSMKKFEMCSLCSKEFRDAKNRRFHAQPDCCSVCGPEFSLYSIKGKKIKANDPIARAAELLKNGRIVAIKGIGGFHIACDATNCNVVKKLRRLKKRPTKPFAIMVRTENLNKIVYLNAQEKKLIDSPVAPMMLLKKKRRIICDEVAPKNPYLGVMAPYAPVHYLLLEKVPYLVMTSANIQDEPIVTDEIDVVNTLGNIVTFYLTHNRKIENRCDDSIGFFLPKKGFSIIRRSRGYVPVPLDLPFPVKPTLGVGPYLKNTFTLANKKEAYISPHIGDLDNLRTLDFFNEMVDKYKRWFRIEPEVIVHDLHPDYLSTKIAHDFVEHSRFNVQRIGVQHHVAHIVSCLAENMVFDDAIGIAFDGTGFGLDGKIWGGEFFIGNLNTQQRVAHLEYLPLPGGDVCIKKPYRTAIAYLYKLFDKNDEIATSGHAELAMTKRNLHSAVAGFRVRSKEINTIINMVKQGWNISYNSSMGRLFDCVAALLGLVKEITYEAEAAINLEYIAAKGITQKYSYKIKDGDPIIIELSDILNGVVRDLKKRISPDVISGKFHNTIVHFSLDVAKKISNIYKVEKVCFSGGVFQNRYLSNLMIDKFKKAGFDVYVHRKLPTNDGCISYGQVIFGNAKSRQ